jgi:hypothetical protein
MCDTHASVEENDAEREGHIDGDVQYVYPSFTH